MTFYENGLSNMANLTSVSFIIPMYNERKTIENTIKELALIAEKLTDDHEIIIADDGSSDGCGLIADRTAQKFPYIKVLHLEKNTKFGGALRAGLNEAKKEVIIYTDSDLPISFSDIKGALSMLGECDIVTAYSSIRKGENLRRIIMSKVYNFLIQSLFRTNIKDINSGFKIYKRKIFGDIKLISNSPFIDVEIFIKAMRKNYIIKQYPVIFKHRERGKSYIARPAVVLKIIMDMLKFYVYTCLASSKY